MYFFSKVNKLSQLILEYQFKNINLSIMTILLDKSQKKLENFV